MRRFASERVSAILKRLGMKEGEEISHPWVTKSITRAQKKVENYHFEIRKNLLEYDAVMNEQRTLVYKQRQQILEGANLAGMIRSMMYELVRSRVRFHLNQEESSVPAAPEDEDGAGEPGQIKPADPIGEISAWLKASYGLVVPGIGAEDGEELSSLEDEFVERIMNAYDEACAAKRRVLGDEAMQRVERFILLLELDEKWKDHLHAMDHLRASIGLRGYGQKDPKVAYKTEGYEMFQEMVENMRSSVTQLVLRVRVREEDEQKLQSQSQLEGAQYRHDQADSAYGRGSSQQAAAEPQPSGPIQPIVNKDPKVGRNAPCPCGSGLKYKRCCGVGK
jgi:preprotein translocase subunit SecA